MADTAQAADAAPARRALALLDLTDLSDQASETGLAQLCAKAAGGPVPVAAICIWPQFVGVARRILHDRTIRIATVVNFPAGGSETDRVCADAAEALRDGADEIDLVLPWRAFLGGDTGGAAEMVREVRAATAAATLKVIIESGGYPDQAAIRRAAELAVTEGADFIKTSTGKTAVSATPEAARTMLEVIRAAGRPVGFKPSGGIRTLEEAQVYLALADEIMGEGWATPASFRFGASGLYDALVAALGGAAAPAAKGTY